MWGEQCQLHITWTWSASRKINLTLYKYFATMFFFSSQRNRGFCSEQMESCGTWFPTNRFTIVPHSPPPPSKKRIESFEMKKIETIFHQRVHERPKVHSPSFFRSLTTMVFACNISGFFPLLLRIATFTLLALISQPLIKRSVTAWTSYKLY